jgi:hypothetical protein
MAKWVVLGEVYDGENLAATWSREVEAYSVGDAQVLARRSVGADLSLQTEIVAVYGPYVRADQKENGNGEDHRFVGYVVLGGGTH